MSYEPRKKARIAFIEAPVRGIGWHGRGITIQPGVYIVPNLDGMTLGIVMLQDPSDDAFLGMVEETSVAEFREVLNGPYAAEWATYYRDNPDVLASWGEQNGRRP